jgi:hypothetical protein
MAATAEQEGVEEEGSEWRERRGVDGAARARATRTIQSDLGSTGFFPGIPRLLLAAGLRVSYWSSSGFLYPQIQVGWSGRRTLRANT